MSIYGFLIAKNEDDIIDQTILSLKRYGGFKKIFLADNTSTDQTFNIMQKHKSLDIEVISVSNEFSDQLKFDLINSKKDLFKKGDWITTLDADELYFKPLSESIQIAENEGANCIEHNTVQFYLTSKEKSYDFDVDRPAIDQRQHYLVNYGELRAFKYDGCNNLTAASTKGRFDFFKPSTCNYPVHHFQYRSKHQIEQRNLLRINNNRHSNNWGHVTNVNWLTYLIPAEYLHFYDGSIKFGLPADANLYKIPDNPAYTMASLNWMKKRGYLTTEQNEFFNASRLKRIYKKLF